ncbi:MAG: gephyrin-like molybdotransferase Glp [Bacteroidota bacterium]
MILPGEAYTIVMENAPPPVPETIGFTGSQGRVLAVDVISDISMPPFDKSAMDGFACRKEDIAGELEIIETIPAGKAPEKTLQKNQCSRIMTGAMIPKAADCVLKIEETETLPGGKIRFTGKNTKPNICYRGEDVEKGDTVLYAGTVIKPQHIAVLASVGTVSVEVYKRPVVGILSTGDEIVEPDKKPGISQIRNSNAYQLAAQVERAGGIANYMGIVEDSEEATYQAIVKALKENDLVLLTGGVSMGDFDFVPKILEKAGVRILFGSIAVQPGKPTTFGMFENKPVFGLPGNPVSSYIQFELLVKPMICEMTGCDYIPQAILLPMGTDYDRKHTEREAWIPVRIIDGKIFPVQYHGSAHIHALQDADGIIAIPIGKKGHIKGEIVHVRQI